jgi:hypothetical protein
MEQETPSDVVLGISIDEVRDYRPVDPYLTREPIGFSEGCHNVIVIKCPFSAIDRRGLIN